MVVGMNINRTELVISGSDKRGNRCSIRTSTVIQVWEEKGRKGDGTREVLCLEEYFEE